MPYTEIFYFLADPLLGRRAESCLSPRGSPGALMALPWHHQRVSRAIRSTMLDATLLSSQERRCFHIHKCVWETDNYLLI